MFRVILPVTPNGMDKYRCTFVIAYLCAWLQVTSAEIVLEHINTVFVPVSYEPDVFRFDDGVGEQLAVNEDFPYVYTIG